MYQTTKSSSRTKTKSLTTTWSWQVEQLLTISTLRAAEHAFPLYTLMNAVRLRNWRGCQLGIPRSTLESKIRSLKINKKDIAVYSFVYDEMTRYERSGRTESSPQNLQGRNAPAFRQGPSFQRFLLASNTS